MYVQRDCINRSSKMRLTSKKALNFTICSTLLLFLVLKVQFKPDIILFYIRNRARTRKRRGGGSICSRPSNRGRKTEEEGGSRIRDDTGTAMMTRKLMKAVERGNDLSTAIVSPVPPDPDLYRQALLVLWGRTCFVNRASFELCWDVLYTN